MDALLTPAILEHLRAVLRNLDGIRSPPARRTAVDVLKNLQSNEALSILQEAHAEMVPSGRRPTWRQSTLMRQLLGGEHVKRRALPTMHVPGQGAMRATRRA